MDESGDDYEESFCSDTTSPNKANINKETGSSSSSSSSSKINELSRQMKELNDHINSTTNADATATNASFLSGEMDLDAFLATHGDIGTGSNDNNNNNNNDDNNNDNDDDNDNDNDNDNNDDNNDDDDDDDNNNNNNIIASKKKQKKVRISIDKASDKKGMKAGGVKTDPSLALMRDKYEKMLEIEKENAARVDALLATFGMMPKDKDAKGSGNTKKSSPTTHTKDKDMNAKINSLLDNNKKKPTSSYAISTVEEVTNTVESAAPKNNLEIQLKNIKKELKLRDERLQRMTEHNMLLTNQNESLKGEVAHLNMKLRAAEQELEAKEERVLAAMKAKKKAAKKTSQFSKEMEKYQELAESYERLEEREQALLSAVEELSTQNQDLISKLKASMQRELDLSHVRASSVIQSAVGAEGAINANIRRAQSDSSSDRQKKTKGKGKVSGMLPDI